MDRSLIYKCTINMADDNSAGSLTCRFVEGLRPRVLDVGCACGDLGVAIKANTGAELYGLELNAESVALSRKTKAYRRVVRTNLDDLTAESFPAFAGKFDYVLCADVLEHLRDPMRTLSILKTYLKPTGHIIASIPNVAHMSIKANLLVNDFTYTPIGLLDCTHMGWVSGLRTWWRCTACTDGEYARIVALDVLRVVAFLFVVFAHVQVQVHQQTLPDWMNVHNFYWGGLGVMMFFFISGVSLSVRSFDRLKTQGCLSFYVSRLRAVLPSYWVAYFISCLLFFACFGVQRMGGDFMTILQTVFAVDGYLANRVMTYNLVGDWYVGCILLLYLIAPFVYWMCKRRPVVALVASFLVALTGLWASQYLTEQTIWWNKTAIFNMPVHLFEFTAGIVFFMYVRQSRRMFLGAALFSTGYCILYCFIPHGPHFSNSALGIPAAVCLCLALCFLLTFVRYSNGVEEVIGWLARNSFLAFLYHHFLIYKVLSTAPCTEPRQFVYDCVLIATLSYVLAWISEKPVAAIRKMEFGK